MCCLTLLCSKEAPFLHRHELGSTWVWEISWIIVATLAHTTLLLRFSQYCCKTIFLLFHRRVVIYWLISDHLLLFVFLLRVFWLNNTAKLKNITKKIKGEYGGMYLPNFSVLLWHLIRTSYFTLRRPILH